MSMDVMGYLRPDGRVGIRNYVAILSAMDNTNPAARRIANIVGGRYHRPLKEERIFLFLDIAQSTALAETEKALKALNDGKTDEALKALEKATGKLELILARDPGLALVPVSVDMVTYDLYADVDTVKAVIKEAREALDEGRVQQARRLMSSLASEVVINTTNIPLATYPDAIKAISPLLDKGETEKAKAALQAALNTLVVTTDVVPLPLLRSQYMLARAEKLAEKKERSEEDDKALNDLLQAADQELKLAEVLGYGSRQDFKPLHEQIGIIREKAAGGNSGKGWFDELKKRLSDLF